MYTKKYVVLVVDLGCYGEIISGSIAGESTDHHEACKIAEAYLERNGKAEVVIAETMDTKFALKATMLTK